LPNIAKHESLGLIKHFMRAASNSSCATFSSSMCSTSASNGDVVSGGAVHSATFACTPLVFSWAINLNEALSATET
jgi:hypothetical protein